MLGKLLKYDLRSVLKYWWLAAVACIGVSFVGGAGIYVLISAMERELPDVISIVAVLGIIATYFAYCAFPFISTVLMFMRFYRNFFTDEGYLTFTLPVKRVTLLNSKIITNLIVMILTYVTIGISAVMAGIMGVAKEIISIEFIKRLLDIEFWNLLIDKILKFLANMSVDTIVYAIIYIAEVVGIIILCIIVANLFISCCITFASVITKRARLITAIGIYFGANGILNFIVQCVYCFGISAIEGWMHMVPDTFVNLIIALILFCVLLFILLVAVLIYIFEYWMLDRKLNMA